MKSHALVLCKSIRCIAIATLAILIILPATAAACGRQTGQTPNLALPWMQGVPNFNTAADPAAPSHGTIVGLWHVTYTTSDNQLFQESFDMWHKDGLELESANINPIEGSLCIGTWKQVGSEIHLHHVGWSFDNSGNLIGPLTLDEVEMLGGHGNSYSGKFDFKQYDTSGNVLLEVTGTTAADRITVN